MSLLKEMFKSFNSRHTNLLCKSDYLRISSDYRPASDRYHQRQIKEDC